MMPLINRVLVVQNVAKIPCRSVLVWAYVFVSHTGPIFKSITNNYNHCICLQFIISFIMNDAFTKSPLLFAIMISSIHSDSR